MNARLHLLAPALVAALLQPLAATAAPAPEIAVSTPDLKDIEFDSGRNGVFCASCNGGAGNARFVHVTKSGEMWVGHIDPLTGNFIHPDGRGTLVDRNVSGPGDVGNGPEWMFSTRGSELVYTRWADGAVDSPTTRSLGIARLVDGAWSAGPVKGTSNRQNPGGTLDLDDPAPRVVYSNSARSQLFWRQVGRGTAPTGEQAIPLQYPQGTSITRRWVPGTYDIIVTAPAAPDADGRIYRQVFLVRTDKKEIKQLTFDPTNKNGAFMWRAPEYGDRWVFFTVADNREILVYRKPQTGDDVLWQVVHRVQTPEDMPYVGSPEYFVHNGRSWVYFWLSNDPNNSTAPSQIAMAGIDAQAPLRVLTADLPGQDHSRRDPEHYVTAEGPQLYYIRMQLPTATTPFAYTGIHRVDTGLGPRLP